MPDTGRDGHTLLILGELDSVICPDMHRVDPIAACVECVKGQLVMARMLLENRAERAKSVVANYEAPFDGAKEFLKHQDSIIASDDRIVYSDYKAEVIL